MDIAQISMNMSQANIENAIGVAMLSKSLDTVETLGNGMTKILDASAMDRSVTPYLGSNIDVTV